MPVIVYGLVIDLIILYQGIAIRSANLSRIVLSRLDTNFLCSISGIVVSKLGIILGILGICILGLHLYAYTKSETAESKVTKGYASESKLFGFFLSSYTILLVLSIL